MKKGFVYILANNRPTLYTGVTNNIAKRVFEHKSGRGSMFTKRYAIHKLVYYKYLEDIKSAIIREKQIKDLNRNEKINLIKLMNPSFKDLFVEVRDKFR
ncbi:hypothetical protein A3C23_05825 [Candidatus Roizmanbacteria bacterium RIFCSPHIGHO2_02_FULL_37_13b]|uniref:GIY-YIG domain-containing protein n=1 Tax=Candidatus Roizmanbacteria bacterium RIFCSPLOWO2_02_FULL_36_11 TaxID=1802071 RepID=A0A1F7JFR2_9BACT|nr:MAG: hypothetical protein A3C23_05825 [Candidatus Roizmanbacteria bacterium RIFCSPHIGHO2_02_FULL_37_13b]OGK54444.1 MAG: hypothetical protein A3H78_06090 [Candidatus Roizmanbacteria bacterium RIFCSPLOWO2_02_FULL_36_11]